MLRGMKKAKPVRTKAARIKMPATAKPGPVSARDRMRAYRERMKAAGLRPVQHWVPDFRDPKVLADFKRQVARLNRHPENSTIDAWIDTVYEIDD
jgi:hypothetical protein